MAPTEATVYTSLHPKVSMHGPVRVLTLDLSFEAAARTLGYAAVQLARQHCLRQQPVTACLFQNWTMAGPWWDVAAQ